MKDRTASRLRMILVSAVISFPFTTLDAEAQQNVFPQTGNVGIGTNNPQSKLQIVNNGGSNPLPWMLSVEQTSNTGANTDANALMRFSHFNGQNSRNWITGTGSKTLFGHPDFFGIHDTVSGTAFIINNIGDIGIGTRTPQGRLVIANNGRNEPRPWMLSVEQTSDTGANTDANALMRFSHFNGQNSRNWITGTGSKTLFGHPDFFGIHDTVSGTAFIIGNTGNVGIGTKEPGAKLHVNGTTRTGSLQITGGADLAEPFEVAAAENAKPGMLVSINPARPGQMQLSSKGYDRTVAGVISGANGLNPGLTMGQDGAATASHLPVALTGRVYTFADAGNGPIEPGDLLTTSDVPGHAMKVTDYTRAQGAIIGKAMSRLESGRGLVLTLVSLQ